MAAKQVVLILGAGPRVGASVAAKFASDGYQVAVASRTGSGSKNDQGYLSLKADFTKTETIPALFEAIKTEFKTAPSVVIYNAAALTPPPNDSSVFSVSPESVTSDLVINTVSPFVAAREAVKGWETLPKEMKKTFIYTGNKSNVEIAPFPMVITLGMGKSASAYWIGMADALYSGKGYRFFYADERNGDGSIKGMAIDGPAHGEFFAQLVTHEGEVPWDATFVQGKGFVKFE